MEILIYYILPNVALFGGLYLLSKGIENAFQFVIENYEDYASGKLFNKIVEAKNTQ